MVHRTGGLIMADARYEDLLIIEGDLHLDAAGQPDRVSDGESIAQDVQHAILESGHLMQMVGERSGEIRRLLLQKIRQVIEADTRIMPGSVMIEQRIDAHNRAIWAIEASTIEFGTINFNLRADHGG
jgi:hypothetical protein